MNLALTARLVAYRDSLGNPDSRTLIADVLCERLSRDFREAANHEALKTTRERLWAVMFVAADVIPWADRGLNDAALKQADEAIAAALGNTEPGDSMGRDPIERNNASEST